MLQPLLDALRIQTCHWIKLTDDQVAKCIEDNLVHQAKGEVVYKPRKKHQVAATNSTTQEDSGIIGADGIKNTDQADSGGNGSNGDNGEIDA